MWRDDNKITLTIIEVSPPVATASGALLSTVTKYNTALGWKAENKEITNVSEGREDADVAAEAPD